MLYITKYNVACLFLDCLYFITRLIIACDFRRFPVDRYNIGHWCLVSRKGPEDL